MHVHPAAVVNLSSSVTYTELRAGSRSWEQ